jgi:hypothetical protein
MDDNDLRAAIEKRGRKITDNLWAYLDRKGYLEDALLKDFDEERVQFLIEEIDAIKSAAAPHKSDAQPVEDEPPAENGALPGPFEVDLADTERERALLYIEAQVRAAASDTRVKEFRDHHCSGGLLSAEGAEAFLESPDASGLDAIANHLHRFHGWHKGEAAWWVLTGEAPNCRPVKVSYRHAQSQHSPDLHLITIEAPPWISPATFQGAFAEMRRRMHAERKPPDTRSIRVVRFVERLRNNPTAANPTFQDMCRQWNEEYPDEAFSEFRSFETAYRRTAKLLHRQYNTDVEREETPELGRQRARVKKEWERIREQFAKYLPS